MLALAKVRWPAGLQPGVEATCSSRRGSALVKAWWPEALSTRGPIGVGGGGWWLVVMAGRLGCWLPLALALDQALSLLLGSSRLGPVSSYLIYLHFALVLGEVQTRRPPQTQAPSCLSLLCLQATVD